jgi:hypothetical protein
MSNPVVVTVRQMLDAFPNIPSKKTRDLLRALCAEVEKLREMDAERVSELRSLEAENTRLRDILDRRFEGGAP